jgi:hypothetical protein
LPISSTVENKNVKHGLLLGAGFSYDFGMPLSKELTDVFCDFFSPVDTMKFGTELARQRPYGKEHPLDSKAIFEGLGMLLKFKSEGGINYEELIAALETEADRPGRKHSERRSYLYLVSIFSDLIHRILTKYQLVSYDLIYHKNYPCFSSFINLLSAEETWVFTLNHDIYLECLAIDMGIPITYGDTAELYFPISNLEMDKQLEFTCSEKSNFRWDSPGFFHGANGINIVKLHGGLSELEYDDRRIICNPCLGVQSSEELMQGFRNVDQMGYFNRGSKILSGKDRVITNPKGELDIAEKSMLTGGKKYSPTTNRKSGEEKLLLFEDILDRIDEMTIIGYGYGDKHINYRISNAMVKNSSLVARLINPGGIKTPEFLEQFDYNDRIQKAMCTGAQWMEYCNSQIWNVQQSEVIEKNAPLRAKIQKSVRETILNGDLGG